MAGGQTDRWQKPRVDEATIGELLTTCNAAALKGLESARLVKAGRGLAVAGPSIRTDQMGGNPSATMSTQTFSLTFPERESLIGNGRDGQIRTDDFLLPKQALYQAELRPVSHCERRSPRRERTGMQVIVFSGS